MRAYIEGISGQPQLYTLDCEARSAADLAGFWGVYIDELDFLDRLPSSDDPNEGFVGDYWGEKGKLPPNSYGVYADPVAALLRDYGLNADSIYGMNFEDLKREVAVGRPVLAWVIGNTWAGQSIAYTPSNGSTIPVVNFEHTVLVIGYDEVEVILLDGDIIYRRSIPVFQNSWAALGNMVVVAR